jgi:hypothetical protein
MHLEAFYASDFFVFSSRTNRSWYSNIDNQDVCISNWAVIQAMPNHVDNDFR